MTSYLSRSPSINGRASVFLHGLFILHRMNVKTVRKSVKIGREPVVLIPLEDYEAMREELNVAATSVSGLLTQSRSFGQ